MRSEFERDTRYPWGVILKGEAWAGEHLGTGQRLAGSKSYTEAATQLDTHIADVNAGRNVAGAAVSRFRGLA